MNRVCWRARTAEHPVSTRSGCCTTSWSTCCWTPPPWAARPWSAKRVRRRRLPHRAGRHDEPEEGELRPQLLDRFGLTVEVGAPGTLPCARRWSAAGWRSTPTRAPFRGGSPTGGDPAAPGGVGSARLAGYGCRTRADQDRRGLRRFGVDGRADIVTARAAVGHAPWHDRDGRDPG